MSQVWLIGGTQESAVLAEMLVAHRLAYLVTVTTESARSLYPSTPEGQVWVGRLDSAQLKSFLQKWQIRCILDASHPFATEVSRLAIAAAAALQISYLRYERSQLNPVDQDRETAISVDSFATLLSGGLLLKQRVLLTVGYQKLELFQSWHDRATLFARILPSVTALEAALSAGFTADRLIALRPPISAQLEMALWRQWQVTRVVTKASGQPGGEDVKRQVAAALGVKLVVIDRPAMIYPQQTQDLAIALDFCRE